MVPDSIIQQQLDHCLAGTDFGFLGGKYSGKVRDSYLSGRQRILVATDRLSCFDRIVTTVPFKGQVLNGMAAFWFHRSKNIVENHLIDLPDPNVMVVHDCEMLPVEVVVRGYLTGSAFRDYEAGRPISGNKLPPGLKRSQMLPEVLITPTTKEREGHDRPISEDEIVSSGLVGAKRWAEVRDKAIALFKAGQDFAAERGLILVDTKYEFGLLAERLVLADEIHTLDSSRYWVKSSYGEHFSRGEDPVMLDKEPVRQWLLGQGFKGDGPIPEFTAVHRCEIARHYISSFEQILGIEFRPEVGPPIPRIEARIRRYGNGR